MPYWRLSSFYFFYFAALGILVPYWGLYLQAQGFDPVAIGILMSILMATKILAPNVWGWLADHLGQRMPIVRWAALASLLAFMGMFVAQGFWQVAWVMVVFSFFWNASLPQFEAVTFNYLGQRVERYGRLRLWGSVGFILAVIGLGRWIDERGPGIVVQVLPVAFAGIWLSSVWVAEPPLDARNGTGRPLPQILRDPVVIALFLSVFLMQMSHGPYYAFFSIYLQDFGYSKGLIGQLWSLGVIAEVSLFWVMHRILRRWPAIRILQVSLLLAAIRWFLIGCFPQHWWVLLVAQSLHAATFGSFHAAAIHMVHHYFQGRNQGRGQALYSSLSFGAGGAVGTFASGFLWQSAGPTMAYVMAASIALLGAGVLGHAAKLNRHAMEFHE